MNQTPDIDFSTDGFFYQMVSAAGISFCGFPLIFNLAVSDQFKPLDRIELKGIVGDDRHFRPSDIVAEARRGNISTDIYNATICMMLVNTAYEAVQEFRAASKELQEHPEFELFRHIRNASSHLNHFHFFDHEPKRPASWRTLTIDATLKGKANPLFGQGCFGNILGVADVFLLLNDIEQILTTRGIQPKPYK